MSTVPSTISTTRMIAVPEAYDLTPKKTDEATPESADDSGLEAGLPTKKACLSDKIKKLPAYCDVDMSLWTTRVKGKNSFGSPIVLIFGAEGAPRMALYRKDEPRGFFPFKLDLEPANGGVPPSFLSGKADMSKASEGLDLQITLSTDQIAFLDRVDAWAQTQAMANSKEWFGRVYSEVDIAAMYTPCLKRDKEDRYPAKLKAKFILSGSIENFFTKVIYMKADGGKMRGVGWDFVKPLLGSNHWRGNENRAVIEIRSVWIVGKKFGLRMNYTDLLVMEKAPGSSDVDFPELEFD
jgi:hypothetical protein